MATILRVSFCFFCDAHSCGAKFQELCFNISRDIFFSILPVFSCKPHDIITNLICIIEKCQYL